MKGDSTRGASIAIAVKDGRYMKSDKYKGLVSEYIVHRRFSEFRTMYAELCQISGEVSARSLPVMPPNPYDKRFYDRADPVRIRIVVRFLNEALEIIMRNDILRCTDAFRAFLKPPATYSRTKTQG